ncbi:MAG: isocitrate dehydrogenase [Actinobacteria bacterium]|nr:isocitrate dehydrogenase [Actinomycetota bacterium]
MAALRIVVLEGDQTGQELLEQSLRLLEPGAIGIEVELERFDLSLENRRRTANGVCDEAARAMVAAGLGLKAATITPEGADDVGSPNRLIREGIDGKVIVRTGRRIPGVTPVGGVHHPISVVRMAVEDAYGAEERRERVAKRNANTGERVAKRNANTGEPVAKRNANTGVPVAKRNANTGERVAKRNANTGEPAEAEDEAAYRTEVIHRSICRAVAEYAFRAAAKCGGRIYGGPKWTVSPTYEGMLKEEMDAAAERHPEVPYEPLLIDATYAGLISGRADAPLVIPALNRDGDLLSDLVLPLFGSIAGAESILLALDAELDPSVAMAEAPHGTAPALEGKDLANPMAMILAVAALLDFAGERGNGDEAASRASAAIHEAVMETTAAGIRTPDLKGHASTTEFTDAVIERVRAALA